jgi:hypothetical protein
VFIIAPDDQTISRDKQQASVRDNVLFEFGLFLGQLGRSRVFGVVCSPADSGVSLKIPTDLFGVNMPHYQNLTKDDLIASMRVVGEDLIARILKAGHRERRDIKLVSGWKLTKAGRFVLTVDATCLPKHRHCLDGKKLALVARRHRKSPVFLFDKDFSLSELYEIPRDNVEFEVDVTNSAFVIDPKPGDRDDRLEGYLLLVPEVFSKNDLIAQGNLEGSSGIPGWWFP